MTRRKPITFTVDSNGCHICTSHFIGTQGYPCVEKDGRNQNLHRVLYGEAHGNLQENQVVRHTCDVRACVNLAHLVAGTKADNTADITERNRHNPPVGERSGTAKLTEAQVSSIRADKRTQKIIASEYGVDPSAISRIKGNKRWAHL